MYIWDVIRVTAVYAFIIALTVIVQSIANFLMKTFNNFLITKDFPLRGTLLVLILLYIIIIAILIDIFIWTTFLILSDLIIEFDDAFSFATDCFTTLGSTLILPDPWEFIGPVIALNGILVIAFAGACLYNILYPTPESGP